MLVYSIPMTPSVLICFLLFGFLFFFFREGTLTNPGPFIFPNGTVLMLFKLCRYPPDCPNHRYISGLLTSDIGTAPSTATVGPAWDDAPTPTYLKPYTRRPRSTPIINASSSIEDPSNGWVDVNGVMHMVVHYQGNQGATMHSPNLGIDWVFNATVQAYPPYINFTDGNSVELDDRQEPKLLLDSTDGQPTHLINICGTHGIGRTWVCIQPICTTALRATGKC